MLEFWRQRKFIGSFSFRHHDPNVFITSRWQTKSTPNVYYFIYRTIVTLYVTVTLLLTILNEEHFGLPAAFHLKWLIYLTNWAYTMVMLQTILALLMLSNAFVINRQPVQSADLFTDKRLVIKLYKCYWVIFNIAMDTSVVVTAMYWGLIYTSDTVVDCLNIFVHVTNSIVMLMEVCVVAHPVRFMQFYVSVCFGSMYGLFTLFYFLAGGTSRTDEPFVYPQLDWRSPGTAVLITMAACIFQTIVHAITFGLYKMLQAIAARIVKSIHEDAPLQEQFSIRSNSNTT